MFENLYGFNKEEIKKSLIEDEILTFTDRYKFVNELKPIYTIFEEEIPVRASTSFSNTLNSQICIMVRTKSNNFFIIVNALFTEFLTEQEQLVLLCHEYGHYQDMTNNYKAKNELEEEARADASSVRYCGFDATIETMKKVDTLVSLAFDYDLAIDAETQARLDILEHFKERKNKNN